MEQPDAQYEKIKPYLLNNGTIRHSSRTISRESSAKNSTGWYQPTGHVVQTSSVFLVVSMFTGLRGLLAAYRFLIDSRDTETDSRLDGLSDAFSVFRCHSIMNCVSVCPKGLNPTRAIGHIKSMLLQRNA
ncbi:hypothetical protein ACLB1S_09700 [Escherichia coli]